MHGLRLRRPVIGAIATATAYRTAMTGVHTIPIDIERRALFTHHRRINMKFNMITVAIASAMSMMLAPAFAQRADTGLERAQQDIHARIEQGVRSGDLSQDEARRLSLYERDLQMQAVRMKRDGYVSRDEQRQMEQAVVALRAEVDDKLTNNRRRGDQTPFAIAQKQQLIHRRIEGGIASGSITPREARLLTERENTLNRLQSALQRDGVMTPAERMQLREQIAVLDDEVSRLIDNNRRAYYTR
jgi:hypothetical protein